MYDYDGTLGCNGFPKCFLTRGPTLDQKILSIEFASLDHHYRKWPQSNVASWFYLNLNSFQFLSSVYYLSSSCQATSSFSGKVQNTKFCSHMFCSVDWVQRLHLEWIIGCREFLFRGSIFTVCMWVFLSSTVGIGSLPDHIYFLCSCLYDYCCLCILAIPKKICLIAFIVFFMKQCDF